MAQNAPTTTGSGLKEQFFEHFQHEVTALGEQMEQLRGLSQAGSERSDAVDHCLASIARLSSEVKDASNYLPAYDQRTYAEAIKGLTEKLAETRAVLAPRPRFAFKTARDNPSSTTQRLHTPGSSDGVDEPMPAATTATAPDGTLAAPLTESIKEVNTNIHTRGPRRLKEPIPSYDQEQPMSTKAEPRTEEYLYSSALEIPLLKDPTGAIALSDCAYRHIRVPARPQQQQQQQQQDASGSGALTSIRSSVINLSAATAAQPLASLQVVDVQDSLLVCGHIDGAAHVTRAQGSTLVVACRQLRLHACADVDVYLLCGSRPIIEDCVGVRVAPFPVSYMLERDEGARNLWDQVDDFKWLKAAPNPHWSVLPVGLRIAYDVWVDLVEGRRLEQLDELLAWTVRRSAVDAARMRGFAT